ncbi:MAG TPA: GHMP kinase [Verrucomicrobiae bacterium]|nr:GHMP kinase [Verrucomicrobiae bacterium]
MIIRAKSYPRAGLIGNPSDGYNGKTIAFVFRNFSAEVVLYETPEMEILPNTRDHSKFESIVALAEDVGRFGYYGGIRLLKATVKRFYDYCRESGIELHNENFTIRYNTNIPSQVGLAGSSAIITACMRALMGFYQVTIPRPVLANLILSVETKELGIPAGLQDRVAQVYEGLVYMDFDKGLMAKQGWGHYEPLDPGLLPPLYLAYRADLAEGTEVLHNDLRERFNRGDPEVLDAIREWADLALQVRDLLKRGERGAIGPVLDRNFDIRRRVCLVSEGNVRMVETARSVGASAKFTGSGGAIVGTYSDEGMYRALEERLQAIGVRVLKPSIAVEGEGWKGGAS